LTHPSEEGITPDELVEIYKSPGRYDDSFLKGMSLIEWSKLHHAYGEASDLPSLFRAILSTNHDHRDFAYHLLYGTIWHQGTVYEATSHAVPFLIRLLKFEEVPDKYLIIGLLDCIALGTPYLSGDEGDWAKEWLTEQGKDFDEEVLKARLDAQKAREAAKQGTNQYLALLQNLEAHVRDETTSLLCSFPESYTVICPALHDQILNEKEPSIRASIIKKTARYLKSIPDPSQEFTFNFLKLFELLAMDIDQQPSVRFSSSLAMADLRPDNISEDIAEILLNSAISPPDRMPIYFSVEDKAKMNDIYRSMAVEDAILALSLLNDPLNIKYPVQALKHLKNPEHAHFTAILILGKTMLNKNYKTSYTGSPDVADHEIYYGYENGQLPINERKRLYPILINKTQAEGLNQIQKEVLKIILGCNSLWEIESNILQAFGFLNSRQELTTILEELQ
jgi:hypothetical protein